MKKTINILIITVILLLTFSRAAAGSGNRSSYRRELSHPITGKDGRKIYLLWAGQFTLKKNDTPIDGDLVLLGCNARLGGRINGNVVSLGSYVTFIPGVKIDRNLTLFYSAPIVKEDKVLPQKETRKLLESDYVKGQAVLLGSGPDGQAVMGLFGFIFALRVILSMLGTAGDGIVAILLIIFSKKRILNVSERIIEKPGRCLGAGALFITLGISILTITFSSSMFIKKSLVLGIVIATVFTVTLGIYFLAMASGFASVGFLIAQKLEDAGLIGVREFTLKGLMGMIIIGVVLMLLKFIPVAGPFVSGLLITLVRAAGLGGTALSWIGHKDR